MVKLIRFTGDVDDSAVFVDPSEVTAVFSMMEKLHRFTVIQLRMGQAFKVSETPEEAAQAIRMAMEQGVTS